MNWTHESLQAMFPDFNLLDHSTTVHDIQQGFPNEEAMLQVFELAISRLASPASSTADRIVCTKLVLACHPKCTHYVRRLLSIRLDDSKDLWEARFTLFCYLDQLGEILSSEERMALLEMVASFLVQIDYSLREYDQDSYAVFMAIDMIVNHWPQLDEAKSCIHKLLRESCAIPLRDTIHSATSSSSRW